MGNKIVDYTDDEGFKRRVLVSNIETDLKEGIPLSLDVDRLYPDAPLAFRRQLNNELWDQELIVAQDFLQPNAPNRIRSALLATVKHDTMAIITFAQENKPDAKQSSK